MNFLSTHARDKVAGLIEAARKGKWQSAAISDVAGGSDEHVCYYAIEEFLFVTWGRVAILMSLETSRCWRDNGAVTRRMRDSGNENVDGFSYRLLTVVLQTGGVRYAFHAVYATDGKPGTPPQDLLCRFTDLRGQVVESVKERACRRLEQSHRPRTRLPEMWSTRAPATDFLARSEDAQLDGRGGLVACRLLCAITTQGNMAVGDEFEVVRIGLFRLGHCPLSAVFAALAEDVDRLRSAHRSSWQGGHAPVSWQGQTRRKD